MIEVGKTLNTIINGDTLEVLKKIPNDSIDMCITSPPYWGLRDYGEERQIGIEENFNLYLDKLIEIFDEVKRVLKPKGSCWVNMGDVYSPHNSTGVVKGSLLGLPERFKIKMIDKGWLCRNEIIWHKPNAMPSSAKTRFNNDYEKLFFFTKTDNYFFETQYEEAKTKQTSTKNRGNNSKYLSIEHESSVRQGMNKNRGQKLIEVRPLLPEQETFVTFIRDRTNIKQITENSTIKKTKVEHWFRRDEKGFSFPSVEDWNEIKWLIDDFSNEFQEMDHNLTYVEYETDDINKNIHKGRIKRAVWSINTKAFKGGHFAPFPEKLIETPILACCPVGGVVMDIFMGSGTTGVVAKNNQRNYIGIDLNPNYIRVAEERILTT